MSGYYWTAFIFEGEPDPNALHCTHKFLGELTDDQADSVEQTIDLFFDSHPMRPINLSFDQADLFGPDRDIQVFKCEVYSIPKIYDVLREALDEFRIDDYRAYRPHITHDEARTLRVIGYVLMKDDDILSDWTARDPETFYNAVKKNSKVLELKPVREDQKYKDEIEKEIRLQFRKLLYAPIMKILGESENRLENSRSDLLKAISSGRIAHRNGVFRGTFNARVSAELKKLGAKWDGTNYVIPFPSLPKDVASSIQRSEDRFKRNLEKIDDKLSQILPAKIAGQIKVSDYFSSAIFKVEKDLNKTLEKITVPAQLTDQQRKEIAEGWSENMKLSIQTFADKEIQDLRTAVQASAFAGNRFETLVKSIEDSYGVTQRKAQFLARQETNLLMAEFRKTRYVSAGVEKYRWRTVVGSAAHPVRDAHKKLDGQIFSWNNPPITTDIANGEAARRNNPGQDYNCRCFAIPIVEF